MRLAPKKPKAEENVSRIAPKDDDFDFDAKNKEEDKKPEEAPKK